MRLVLAGCLLSLAACRHHGAPEPAWPKSAGHVAPEKWEDDGGESLEPQQASHIAAVERAEDRTPAVEAEAIVVEAPAAPKGDAKPDGKPDAKPDAKTDAKPPTGEIEVIEIKPEDIVIDR